MGALPSIAVGHETAGFEPRSRWGARKSTDSPVNQPRDSKSTHMRAREAARHQLGAQRSRAAPRPAALPHTAPKRDRVFFEPSLRKCCSPACKRHRIAPPTVHTRQQGRSQCRSRFTQRGTCVGGGASAASRRQPSSGLTWPQGQPAGFPLLRFASRTQRHSRPAY